MFNLTLMELYIMCQYEILLLYLFASFNDFFILKKDDKYEINKSIKNSIYVLHYIINNQRIIIMKMNIIFLTSFYT